MEIEQFSPVKHLIQVTKTNGFYQGQNALVTGDSLLQGLGLESGTFTPVISNEVDCTVTVLRGIYSRVDNVVTMSIYLSIGLDTAGDIGTFNVDLPVASTFANGRDLFGVASIMTNPVTNLGQYVINADTANNKCYIEVSSDGVSTAVTDFVANIQYLVQ
jgi:hypothetical protein